MTNQTKPPAIGVIVIRGNDEATKNVGLEISAGKTRCRVISTLDFKAMHSMSDPILFERTALAWVRQELMRCTRNATGGEVFLVCAAVKSEKTLQGILEVATYFSADFGVLNLEEATAENGYCDVQAEMLTTLEEVNGYVG